MAQSTYRIVDVGTLLTSGAHFSYSYGVNDSGQVAGFSYVLTGYRAFLYDPATGFLLNLGDLVGGDDFSVARAVNDSGIVVGSSSTVVMIGGNPVNFSHAFRWDSGAGIVDFAAESLPDGNSRARGINSAGQIVGEFQPDGVSTYIGVTFLMTPGDSVDFLPHLLSGPLPNTQGNAINDSAVVVGKGSDQATPSTAYWWRQSTGIETLTGNPGLSSEATEINGVGAVTGKVTLDDGQGGYIGRAFSWSESDGMTVIDLLPGWVLGRGYGINDSGLVVGTNWVTAPIICIYQDFPMPPTCFDDSASDRAFIWSPSFGTVQLDTLIDPEDPLFGNVNLTSAWDISNAGYIAANGFVQGESGQHAFLLIPGLFGDGFESGNTTAWSATLP